jgi:hypothetical protein
MTSYPNPACLAELATTLSPSRQRLRYNRLPGQVVLRSSGKYNALIEERVFRVSGRLSIAVSDKCDDIVSP